jgi:hypothetical protein
MCRDDLIIEGEVTTDRWGNKTQTIEHKIEPIVIDHNRCPISKCPANDLTDEEFTKHINEEHKDDHVFDWDKQTSRERQEIKERDEQLAKEFHEHYNKRDKNGKLINNFLDDIDSQYKNEDGSMKECECAMCGKTFTYEHCNVCDECMGNSFPSEKEDMEAGVAYLKREKQREIVDNCGCVVKSWRHGDTPEGRAKEKHCDHCHNYGNFCKVRVVDGNTISLCGMCMLDGVENSEI